MNELARLIAQFIRMKTKDTDTPLKPTTEKRSKHQLHVDVKISGMSDIQVNWFSGGAEVAGRRFHRGADGEFDVDPILDHIADILKGRFEALKQRKREEEMVAAHKPIKDLVRNDPRISTSVKPWRTPPTYEVEFSTPSFTEMSMAIDFLMSLSDPHGAPPPQRPSLATAVYVCTPVHGSDKELTLRELARLDEMSQEVWDKVLALCVSECLDWSGGRITRTE